VVLDPCAITVYSDDDDNYLTLFFLGITRATL
jgi:hypothetical protein